MIGSGLWLCSLCISCISCGGLSRASDCDYLQTAESSCLEPAGNRSFSTWLKILQSWKLEQWGEQKKIGEGVRQVARAVSKGTQVTPAKWYQGKELFLFPVALSLTKSRWLGRTRAVKVPLIHLQGSSFRWLPSLPERSSGAARWRSIPAAKPLLEGNEWGSP